MPNPINPELPEKLQKLAHGGIVGSAHPAILRELHEAEIRKQALESRLGKLAHGGVVGSAHPGILEELSQPEIRETPT